MAWAEEAQGSRRSCGNLAKNCEHCVSAWGWPYTTWSASSAVPGFTNKWWSTGKYDSPIICKWVCRNKSYTSLIEPDEVFSIGNTPKLARPSSTVAITSLKVSQEKPCNVQLRRCA